MKSDIKFADEKVLKSLEKLKTSKTEDKKLLAWIERTFEDLEENAFCGTQIPKKLFPKDYVTKYQIDNLWKYNQPNVFKAIQKRSHHWEPRMNYSDETRHTVLTIAYNRSLQNTSTGADHFDHITVPLALTITDVEKYANQQTNYYFSTPSWMKKGTIQAYPHSLKKYGEKIVLVTSNNF